MSLQSFDFLSSEHFNEDNAATGGQTHNRVECGGVWSDSKLHIRLSIKIVDTAIVNLQNVDSKIKLRIFIKKIFRPQSTQQN